jgi:predicted nucleic acid-binding protein
VKWLLDTNVVSEQVSPYRNNAVVDWVARRSPEQIAVSAVTMAELRVGVLATSNERRRRELARWFDDELSATLGRKTLPITLEILIDWLSLGRKLSSIGKTRAPADLLIAATARVHDLIVVTRNTRDFDGTGIIVYNPWSGKTHIMDAS